MISRTDIQQWAGDYSSHIYPPRVYEELVVEKRLHRAKLEIMGAWKTGCLRESDNAPVYEDTEGSEYSPTRRWKPECPVGYHAWRSISKREREIQRRIPSMFPIKQPDVFTDLLKLNQINFVLASFVLHVVNPEVYPLYDQHVYRMFRFSVTDGQEAPKNASRSWRRYFDYQEWFHSLCLNVELPFYIVDRGLMSRGKQIMLASLNRSKPRNQ